MAFEIWEWLLRAITSAGFIGMIVFLFRDTVGKFFSKAVEHRFEKRLETFKGELRDNEKELEQMRSFLVSAQRDRDSTLQAKRLEAAELLLRARDSISQLSMLVEYMKILNTEKILEEGDDPKIADFVNTLLKPFDLDAKFKEIGNVDTSLPRLYLSEKSLKAFDAHRAITFSAAAMLKLMSIPLRDKGKLLDSGELSKTIVEQVPSSKAGFDQFGEKFAYHWSSYFCDLTLQSLRHEIFGGDDLVKATKSIASLALDSRKAQLEILSKLEVAGLRKDLIQTEERVAASSSAVEKAKH